MAHVLKADATLNDAFVEKTIDFPGLGSFSIQFDLYVPQASLDAACSTFSSDFIEFGDGLFLKFEGGVWKYWTDWAPTGATGSFDADACHTISAEFDGTNIVWTVDGVEIFNYAFDPVHLDGVLLAGAANSSCEPGIYIDNVTVGTGGPGSGDVFSDGFESGDLSAWDSTFGDVSAIVDTVTDCSGGATHTLTVHKAGAGSGTVTSSPSGINCGSDCSEVYNDGDVVTLTAVAAPGSVFVGWSGGGCGGTGTCVLTLTGNTNVTATFDQLPLTDNTTCETAATISGTSGSVVADNTSANGFDFATDPLFNDDCFGFAAGGGGPLWWKYRNPFSRAVILRIHVEPPPSGTAIPEALYGIFRGSCGAWTRDLYPTSGELRTQAGYSRHDPSVAIDEGLYIEAAVAPGETVYVEVDGYSGDTTDPVVLTAPQRGRFKLRWSVLSMTTRDAIEESVDEAEDNCGVAGDSYVEAGSVVEAADGGGDTQTARAEDYVELDGDSWFTSAWDSRTSPDGAVHRWNGSTVVSYLLPVSGIWERVGIQLNTDGETLWAVTMENGGPLGTGWPNPRAGHPDEPSNWNPAYPVVFRYDPGTDGFVLVGRMIPRSANVYGISGLGSFAKTGRVGSFDSTAHPSMPGRCYVVWNEKGGNGTALTSADFDANGQWIEHMAIGCFGDDAPFTEFDVGLSSTPIAIAETNNSTGDADAGETSPVGNVPYYLPRIGRVLLANDQGVCQIFRMEAQPIADLDPGPSVVPGPYQAAHVLCEQVEDGATLTLKQTITYAEPAGSGIEDNNGFAGLGNGGYANHMSIEPVCHGEKPLDSAEVWGFIRQGDAFPGNHPDWTTLPRLGITGVLWLDTDPTFVDLVASRPAGFKAGVWTNASSGQSAASFAAQASGAVDTYAPDLLVLDVEVYYGTDPSSAWTWHDDMIAAFRALQPTQRIAVTMGPLHDDFNYAAYTAADAEVWPQSYGPLISDHFDPIDVFDRVVANGVDPGLVAPVLGAPSYPADVDELAVAGHRKWSVFTLDDRPRAPVIPSTVETETLRTLIIGWVWGNFGPPDVSQGGIGLAYNLDPLLAAPERWFNDNAQANGNDVFVNLPVPSSWVPNGGGGGRRTLHRDRYGETWAFVGGFGPFLPKAVFYDRFCNRAWVSNVDPPFQDDSATPFQTHQRMQTGRQVTWHEPSDFVRTVSVYEADPDVSHHPWFVGVGRMQILRKWIICEIGAEVEDELGNPILAIFYRTSPSNAAPASPTDFSPPVHLSGIRFRARPSGAAPADLSASADVHLNGIRYRV